MTPTTALQQHGTVPERDQYNGFQKAGEERGRHGNDTCNGAHWTLATTQLTDSARNYTHAHTHAASAPHTWLCSDTLQQVAAAALFGLAGPELEPAEFAHGQVEGIVDVGAVLRPRVPRGVPERRRPRLALRHARPGEPAAEGYLGRRFYEGALVCVRKPLGLVDGDGPNIVQVLTGLTARAGRSAFLAALGRREEGDAPAARTHTRTFLHPTRTTATLPGPSFMDVIELYSSLASLNDAASTTE